VVVFLVVAMLSLAAALLLQQQYTASQTFKQIQVLAPRPVGSRIVYLSTVGDQTRHDRDKYKKTDVDEQSINT
jgi:hypothetical protein